MKLRFNSLPACALAAAFCLLPAALWAQSTAAPASEEAQRIAAVRKLADDAYRARDVETGNQRLRELIEAYPGRWDIARPALETILKTSLRDGPAAWQEYAAARLIAAYRAGRILPTDPVLRDAWGTFVTLRGYQERFLQAKAEIDALAEATGTDVWVEYLEAVLSYHADSYETESRFARLLPRISTDDNDPYVWRVWQGIYPTEGNRPNPKFLESATSYQSGRLLPSTAPRNLYIKDFSPGWQAIRDLPVESVPSQLHTLIGDALEEGRFLADDNAATITWLWNVVDRRLLSDKPEARLPLRQTQQSELQKTRLTGPLDRFRRFPWTDEGQRALLDYGRRELALGRVDTALRSFRDVLSRASTPALLAEAQVGLWLALAQQGSRDAFDAAFRSVKPDERYPWMGGTESAQRIRERLQGSVPAAASERPAPSLTNLNRRLVKLPAIAPWPASLQGHDQGVYWLYGNALMKSLPFARVGMQLHDDGLLVSSPNIMAWYRADDPATPVWQRTPRFTFANSRRQPGNYVPPVVGNRIYTRWGQVDGCPSDIAALDLQTGRQLWSTAQDNTWRNQNYRFRGTRHWPLNDPVHAAGRLYLLAAKMTEVCTSTDGVYLMCMDPDTGALQWTCKVSDEEIKGSASWFPEYTADLAIYGNAVTPHQGAVYCDTSGGIVARVDARDGRLEWAHRYPCTKYSQKERPGQYPHVGEYPLSLGARPLVIGKQVIFMPRDHNGVFALEADTGRLLWQNALVHPTGAVGIFDGSLLVYDYRTVVALDLATGATRWFRPMEEGIFGDVRLIGSAIYLGTADALYRLDAGSGLAAERMAWNEKGRQVLDFAILDNTLYLVSDEAAPTIGFEPVVPLKPPAAGAADKITLPLRRAWKLTRANPQLYKPAPEAGLDGRVFLLSDGVLECILLNPTPSVAWQRLVQPDLAGVRLARGLVVLDYPARPVFLDGKTGTRQEPRFASDAPGLNDLPPLYRLTANGNRLEAVNNATGERLWQETIPGIEGGAAQQVGNEVHVIGLRKKGDPRDTLDVVFSLTNGDVLATYPVLSQSSAVPVRFAFRRQSCFFLAAQGNGKPPYMLYRYAMDGKPAQPVPDCPAFTFAAIAGLRAFAESGPYIALQVSGSVEGFREHQTGVIILKENDPSYVFVTGSTGSTNEVGSMPGLIRGDRYYDALPEKGIARISDLKKRQTLASGEIPSWNAKYCRLLELLPLGDSLLVLWSLWELHVEAFDLASGARKGTQVLGGVDYTRWPLRDRTDGGMAGRGPWENEMTEGPGMLLITDRAGLHALVPADRLAEPAVLKTFPKLYRRREPIALDGSLAEWTRGEYAELSLHDAGGRPASLLLAQNGRQLFAALSYEDARVDPLRGEGLYNDGDWIRIRQNDGPFERHARIGLDPRRGAICKPEPDGKGRMIDAAAGIGHDLKASRHIYEVAIPLTITRTWAQDALSLAVFDERGSNGPTRIIDWENIPIGYHAFTRAEEAAMFALISEIPDLPESRALYARLKTFYDAWATPMPPYPSSKGPPEPAKAVASLKQYLSVMGEDSFPYSFYQLIKRYGGPEALSPAVREWYQRKEKIESVRQGPYPLSDGLCVTNWLVLGYFPYPVGAYGLGIDFLQGVGGEPRHVPNSDVEVASGTGAKARWLPYVSPTDNIEIFEVKHLNLGLEAMEGYFAIYAACWLKAEDDTECTLLPDALDDDWKVFLDHEPLAQYSPHRGELDAKGFRVRLEKGLHMILIKVSGTRMPTGAGHPPRYAFRLRVTDPSGAKPAGITVWN